MRSHQRVRQPRDDAIAADQREHLEEPGTDGLPGHRDARRVNQRAGLDAALVGQRAQRGFERRRHRTASTVASRSRHAARCGARSGADRCFATAAGSRSIASQRNGRSCGTSRPASSRAASRRSIDALDPARDRPVERRAPAGRPPRDPAACARRISRAGSRMMCCWLNQSSFSGLKTALPPLMPSSVNARDQLVAREQLLVAARRPAEQREEIDHRLGQIALLLVLRHRRRAVALAQPLLVGPENQRHVRERRHRRAERVDRAAPASACSRCGRRRAPRA